MGSYIQFPDIFNLAKTPFYSRFLTRHRNRLRSTTPHPQKLSLSSLHQYKTERIDEGGGEQYSIEWLLQQGEGGSSMPHKTVCFRNIHPPPRPTLSSLCCEIFLFSDLPLTCPIMCPTICEEVQFVRSGGRGGSRP